MAMGQQPVISVNIPIPTKTKPKWVVHQSPKMVPLALTHGHIAASPRVSHPGWRNPSKRTRGAVAVDVVQRQEHLLHRIDRLEWKATPDTFGEFQLVLQRIGWTSGPRNRKTNRALRGKRRSTLSCGCPFHSLRILSESNWNPQSLPFSFFRTLKRPKGHHSETGQKTVWGGPSSLFFVGFPFWGLVSIVSPVLGPSFFALHTLTLGHPAPRVNRDSFGQRLRVLQLKAWNSPPDL